MKKKKDCNRDLEIRKTQIIEFRCKECGYKNKIIAKDKKWKYEN